MPPKYTGPTLAPERIFIWRLLEEIGGMEPERLDAIWQGRLHSGQSLESVLLETGVIDDSLLAHLYSQHFLLPLFDPPEGSQPPIDVRIAELLDADFCCERMIAPLADDGTTIDVAIVSPDAFQWRDEIRSQTGRQTRHLFAPMSVVRRVLEALYPEAMRRRSADAGSDIRGSSEHLQVDSPPQAPEQREATEFLHSLMERALERRATEIHLEPFTSGCRIRMRINGSLTQVAPPGSLLIADVIAYLRRLAKIDRDHDAGLPQEGSIRLRHGRRRVLMPVCAFPTIDGVKYVLHIQARHCEPPRIEELGLDGKDRNLIQAVLEGGPALMLVTGPKHSGKRWTLYAALQVLNTSERNLYSVEATLGPPLPGVNRVRVRPSAGWTAAMAVRGLLRQHADAILVAEVDDPATAGACIEAVANGAVVIASVHAENPAKAIERMAAEGIAAADLDKYLKVVINQRRLRRLCAACRAPDWPKQMGADPVGAGPADGYAAVGCSHCGEKGYRGQIVAFDVLAADPAADGCWAPGDWDRLVRHPALATEAMERRLMGTVARGTTSIEEVRRVLKR